jgi:hypothetical protein
VRPRSGDGTVKPKSFVFLGSSPHKVKTFSELASLSDALAPPGGERQHRDLSVAISSLSRDLRQNPKTFFLAKIIHRIGAKNIRDKKSLR